MRRKDAIDIKRKERDLNQKTKTKSWLGSAIFKAQNLVWSSSRDFPLLTRYWTF